MKANKRTKQLKIGGMTCIHCEHKIAQKLRNTAGVTDVQVHYRTGTADISFDAGLVSLQTLIVTIEKLGYSVLAKNAKPYSATRRMLGFLTVIVLLYVLLQYFGVLNLLVPSQLADSQMGYGMLLLIGLITSVHCVAMCGGITLSQCMPHTGSSKTAKGPMAAFVPAFRYNLGRVLSYTVIGFIFGFVGMLFGGSSGTGLPVMAQGILKIAAGGFMAIMGINMLDIFPWLRKFQPRIPKFIRRKVHTEKVRSSGPFLVGLLNGFMPCGPLQSMQLVALAAGNPFAGALSMLLFSLGTVPLMLGLGSAVSALGHRFTQRVMGIGAVLVVVLGLAMLSQGGSLSGLFTPGTMTAAILGLSMVGIAVDIPFSKPGRRVVSALTGFAMAVLLLVAWNGWATTHDTASGEKGPAEIVNGSQIVRSVLSGRGYPSITVAAGTPVIWTINAPEGSINGCNNRINIQEFGITNYAFAQGDNVILFTPTKAGQFSYSCWMGMIHGSITVTAADAATPDAAHNDASQKQ